MSDIAMLGLGAMGSRMAGRLLDAGHGVTVWNRTPGRADDLVRAGAKLAATPKEAAAISDIVIAMVRDDAASRRVWLDPSDGAFAGMRRDCVAIDSSTLTPRWVRELGATAEMMGLSFVEAPVSGSRPQADAGQLIFLAGGDGESVAKVESVLKVMGGAVHLAGPLGAGALVKLTTNALLGVQTTALAELIGMLRRSGVDPARALEIVSKTAVWSPFAQGASQAMLRGAFDAMFPVDLVEKDFGYVLDTAGPEAFAPTLAAARGVFAEAKSRGLGNINLTGVVRLQDGQ